MVAIDKRITRFVWYKAPLSLPLAVWKSNIRVVRVVNSVGSGFVSYDPTKSLNGLLTIQTGMVVELDAIGWENGGFTIDNGEAAPTGGVSDHGVLQGLGDDDHPQYFNAARLTQVLATANEANRNRANHTGRQDISTIEGLQAVLDGKAADMHLHTPLQVDGFTADQIGPGSPAGNLIAVMQWMLARDTGTPTPTQLTAPTGSQATALSTTSLNITASAVPNASSYKLLRSATSGGTFAQVGGALASPVYTDSGLSNATTYYYKWQTVGNGTTYLNSPLGVEFSGTTQTSTTTTALTDDTSNAATFTPESGSTREQWGFELLP
ncbi:hypothetical protein [Hymenobacter sediminicola]|uniref:Fibronectin type-III domain-containing protein n=1 Tax=Hymenobacter sediminicola TaxID=2761579 RepID=A0A7G7W760_9BACT|nr:hypothetical protein [Hymenobacter sediminicola]QNH62203.1 hypothetical protein H4317_19035 [Hymenobacter sediminicola]